MNKQTLVVVKQELKNNTLKENILQEKELKKRDMGCGRAGRDIVEKERES